MRQGTVDGEAERGKIHRGVLAMPIKRKAGRLHNITESNASETDISRL